MMFAAADNVLGWACLTNNLCFIARNWILCQFSCLYMCRLTLSLSLFKILYYRLRLLPCTIQTYNTITINYNNHNNQALKYTQNTRATVLQLTHAHTHTFIYTPIIRTYGMKITNVHKKLINATCLLYFAIYCCYYNFWVWCFAIFNITFKI